MRKIPSLFIRDFGNNPSLVLDIVTPGCEWVVAGDGQATEKFDGTACAVIDGKLYARYDCKPSKKIRRKHIKGTLWQLEDFKTLPEGAIPCQEPDLITGHWPHWVKAVAPQYKYHLEAWHANIPNGTYELVGPKVGNNPYNLEEHQLWEHGCSILENVPTSFDDLKATLEKEPIEGIVWHHPDGRMAKVKKSDFGLRWS